MPVHLDYKVMDSMVGALFPAGANIVPSPNRADRLWGSPRLVFRRHRNCFARTKAAGASD